MADPLQLPTMPTLGPAAAQAITKAPLSISSVAGRLVNRLNAPIPAGQEYTANAPSAPYTPAGVPGAPPAPVLSPAAAPALSAPLGTPIAPPPDLLPADRAPALTESQYGGTAVNRMPRTMNVAQATKMMPLLVGQADPQHRMANELMDTYQKQLADSINSGAQTPAQALAAHELKVMALYKGMQGNMAAQMAGTYAQKLDVNGNPTQ